MGIHKRWRPARLLTPEVGNGWLVVPQPGLLLEGKHARPEYQGPYHQGPQGG